MKIKWTQNWGLKIGSFLFAVILWVLVTNINDPVAPQPFNNIPVKITHTELLEESGLAYEVLDNTDIISKVTVWAPRSVIAKLSSGSISATADMNDLSSLDTISIKLAVNNYEITRISGSSDIVKLKIEEMKTKTLPVRVSTSGELTEGYILGEITTEQNLVKLTGPESLMESIVEARADIEVTSFTGDINTDAEILLYDADGVPVATDRITQSIKTVRVRIPILETKMVPLNYSVTGTPVSGFKETGVVGVEPASVLIAGKSSIIKKISSIDIPDTVLDVTGSTEDYVKTVDLIPYLPEDTRLVDASGNMITFTVYIEPEVSKNITLQEARVKIVNMPEGYRGSFSGLEEDTVVTLIGLRQDLDGIHTADVMGEINIEKMMEDRNLEKLSEGFYTAEVELNLGNNITILEPIEVTVHVTTVEE